MGTVHRPVLMALEEEEAGEEGMASTSPSLTSSLTSSPLKAIASVVFPSSLSSSSSQPQVNGSMTTPKPVKKDIYRGVCQLDDSGRNGQKPTTTTTEPVILFIIIIIQLTAVAS